MSKKWSLLILIVASLSGLAFQGANSLRGRVLDLQDKPVSGVKLVVTSTQDASFSETLETKDNGSFVVPRVPMGPGTVTAEKTGHVSRTYEFTQERGSTRVIYRMVAEGLTYESLGPQPDISGVVEDTKGVPIPNVKIRVYSQDLPGFQKELETDGAGAFETPGLQNAEITVHAKKEGYRDQLYRFTQGKRGYKLRNYRMQTMEEYYAESGKEGPKEKTPEDMAIDLYNKAVEPYKNNDFALAEKLAKQAIGLDPNQDAAVKMLIFSNYKQNDWKDVLAFSEQFLEKHPEDENILNYALEAARRVKDNTKETQLTQKLRKLKPETADTVFQDAVAALNADDDDGAKKHIARAIELDPNFPEPYYELGKIYIREGEFEKAVTNFKLFLKHAPKDHRLREEVTDLIVTLSE